MLFIILMRINPIEVGHSHHHLLPPLLIPFYCFVLHLRSLVVRLLLHQLRALHCFYLRFIYLRFIYLRFIYLPLFIIIFHLSQRLSKLMLSFLIFYWSREFLTWNQEFIVHILLQCNWFHPAGLLFTLQGCSCIYLWVISSFLLAITSVRWAHEPSQCWSRIDSGLNPSLFNFLPQWIPTVNSGALKSILQFYFTQWKIFKLIY